MNNLKQTNFITFKIPRCIPRDFFMRLTILIFLVSGFQNSFAQRENTIVHYQKKWHTDSLHKVCKQWNPMNLIIPIPTSDYKSGKISVSKLIWAGQKGYRYEVAFLENKVNRVTISCSREKSKAQLLDYKKQMEIRSQHNLACLPLIKLNNEGRSSTLIISLL